MALSWHESEVMVFKDEHGRLLQGVTAYSASARNPFLRARVCTQSKWNKWRIELSGYDIDPQIEFESHEQAKREAEAMLSELLHSAIAELGERMADAA